MDFKTILIVVLYIWSLALSVAVVWMIRFFLVLSKKVEKGNLVDVLDKVLNVERANTKTIRAIKKEVSAIQDSSKLYIQKFALERFNPFEEIGGDQSFSIALLDRNGDGLILTGLHTRERTRIYVKNISGGKSKTDLSKEEDKVLKKALARKI